MVLRHHASPRMGPAVRRRRACRRSVVPVLVCVACGAGATSAFARKPPKQQPPPPPPPTATSTGTVALWHMDETSGTVMTDSVGGHTGSLHSVQLGQPGFLGTAYGFSGSGYVSVPSAADLNPGSANLTVTIHIKTTSAPATPDWDIIRKGLYTTPGGEWKMEYQPSGQASCGFKGSSGYSELIAGPSIKDGRWHTVQCRKTSSSIQVIVDGQAFSKAANVGSIANSVDMAIGARPGSEYFRGSLDEASVTLG